MKAVKRKVGKYELGRTIGEGTFAKVKFAQNTETGDSVAIKVLAKSTILKHKMVDQVFFLFLYVAIVTNFAVVGFCDFVYKGKGTFRMAAYV